MHAADELDALLLVARQELRLFEEASADAKVAARAPGQRFTSEDYLSIAADLDRLAAGKRLEIAELEEQRSKLP